MVIKQTINISDRITIIYRKYTELETACEVKWNFHNALFFAGTVATTIGYGKLTPETFYGRLWCIFYLSLGIPYFAILTSTLSDSLNVKLARFESTKKEATNKYQNKDGRKLPKDNENLLGTSPIFAVQVCLLYKWCRAYSCAPDRDLLHLRRLDKGVFFNLLMHIELDDLSLNHSTSQ